MTTEKLKSLVVSEELAKRLKTAGFPQTSHFGWIAGCVMAFPETTIWECAAPTASEIDEQLPWFIQTKESMLPYRYLVFKHKNGFTSYFMNLELASPLASHTDKNGANCRAMTWLELKEKGLL